MAVLHALWRAMTADTSGNMQISRILNIWSEKNLFTAEQLVVCAAVFSLRTTANYSQFSVVADEGLLLLVTEPDRHRSVN
jgi:hypothetical protein